MRARSARFLVAIAAVGACCACFAPAARAGEIQLDLGAALRRSSWSGDWAGGFQLGGGYRFARVLAVDFAVWEEPASVDRRLNTGLSLGVTAAIPREGIRPTLRAYFIHQHEEGFVSIADHPFGTVAGIGAGIRHRAGLGARLGVEIPLAKKQKRVEWFALAGLDVTWFPDATLGPAAYVGAMGGIGLNYSLEDAP
jgi:hypothetical protein